MKVRFQADADLNEVILLATIRQQPEIDFQTATAAELAGISDLEVLERCLKDNRLLVTHDRKTMPRHFYRFIERNESPGVIVIPQSVSVSEATEDLILIWSATDAEEWKNRIAFLPL
jgi:hypothetical protein